MGSGELPAKAGLVLKRTAPSRGHRRHGQLPGRGQERRAQAGAKVPLLSVGCGGG